MDAKILVVDDDPMNIFVITELLKQYNLNANSASNGSSAVVAVKKSLEEAKMYKLILLDYSLGDTNGTEVAQTIR